MLLGSMMVGMSRVDVSLIAREERVSLLNLVLILSNILILLFDLASLSCCELLELYLYLYLCFCL